MQAVFQPGGGTLMTWHWNHRNGNACASECGRWVVTQIYAGCFELWDCTDRKVIGTYRTVTEAQKAADMEEGFDEAH